MFFVANFKHKYTELLHCLCVSCYSKDDLVVGAPFYFERGVGGAIYIYLSTGDQVCIRLHAYLKMT